MRKQFNIMLFIALTSFVLIGCKSKEKLVVDKGMLNSKSLVENILIAQPTYETIDFKRMQITLNLNNKQNFKSNATGKVIRNSMIHFSIQPFLGIEMFVVRLTPDYIYVLDKTKGVYYQESYQLLEMELGIEIDYKTFEAAFTNQLFALGQNEKANLEKLFKRIANKKLSSSYQSLSQQITVNDGFRIQEMKVQTEKAVEEFKVDYADFIETAEADFPSKINFQFKSPKEIYTFELLISRLAINENISVQDINYQQYRKGNIYSFLKK